MKHSFSKNSKSTLPFRVRSSSTKTNCCFCFGENFQDNVQVGSRLFLRVIRKSREGHRGLVGLFTTHGTKVRGFESRLLFFFRRGHPSARRQKRIGRTNDVERENAKMQERRREEEKPAGERGERM